MSKSVMIQLTSVAAVIFLLFAIPYVIAGHVPTIAHLWKLGIVGSVTKYLLSAFGVWMTYVFSKAFVAVSRVKDDWVSQLKVYAIALGACALLAAVCGHSLGTHKEDSDPYFGGGDTVVDYEPTDDQRIRHALTIFLCLCIPTMYGINAGLIEMKLRGWKPEQLPPGGSSIEM